MARAGVGCVGDRRRRRPQRWRHVLAVTLSASLIGACSSDGTPRPDAPPSGSPSGGSATPTVAPDAPMADDGEILIDAAQVVRPFDRRLLGTNVPAWLGPAKVSDPAFAAHMRDSGATMVRMPGGSWSSAYDWLACENGTEDCLADGVVTPSDYAQLMKAAGVEGMWTVNFNETAQQAAALVAFFNGDVDDDRRIGVDRNGDDWKTVGTWAQLRAEHGHAEPLDVRYWEIGNEVYGAQAATAPGCASFGWEDVWTCDGTEYVEGDEKHDGYLAFRDAMKLVDPDIQVGAVGIGGYQSQWSGFGQEVIEGAGADLDFYVVHDYGFDSAPTTAAVLRRSESTWDDTIGRVRAVLDGKNPDRSVPIFVTEYNLFAFFDADTDGLMSKSVNALYIADTIGQMVEHGVDVANQWDFANGANPNNGSDYGLFHAETEEPNPQFYGFALWSRFGDEVLASDAGFDPGTELTAFASRSKDGSVVVLAVNKSAKETVADVRVTGGVATYDGTADVATMDSLEATSMTFNGSTAADTGLDAPGTSLGSLSAAGFEHVFPPMSISVLTLRPAAAPPATSVTSISS